MYCIVLNIILYYVLLSYIKCKIIIYYIIFMRVILN